MFKFLKIAFSKSKPLTNEINFVKEDNKKYKKRSATRSCSGSSLRLRLMTELVAGWGRNEVDRNFKKKIPFKN